MTLEGFLSSPLFWTIFGGCFLAGWYAKRSFIKGLGVTLIAPMVIVPLWILITVVLSLPTYLLRLYFPKMMETVAEVMAELPESAIFLFHPSTILAGVLLFLYSKSERETAHLPPAGGPNASPSQCANPLRKTMVR